MLSPPLSPSSPSLLRPFSAVGTPKYRLRNYAKCLSRSEMQSQRVGFGTAARVLRTINMNYGKRSRTGPKGIARGIVRCIYESTRSEYGSRRSPRREYIVVHFCEVAGVAFRFSERADRFDGVNCKLPSLARSPRSTNDVPGESIALREEGLATCFLVLFGMLVRLYRVFFIS